MNRTIRFLLGYLIGGTLFVFIIPYGFFQLSRLDYLLNYQMIINSMILRYIISALLLITGFTFIIWSNLTLYFKGKGGPADVLGMAISPRTTKLVTRGPYRYSRNPMVFGAMMIYMAMVMYMNSIIGLIVFMVCIILSVFYLKRSEERRLLKDFGQEYQEYRKKVAMIIPFIKFR
jgi:protein-S-isoprenylcysteine O-methyltransferase Ste14